MSLADESPGRDQLKAERVYGVLRRRIRELDLAPGEILRKDLLAAEFGVSRAPVNEAIARLAEERLVDVFPQHGTFVAAIKASDVREGLFVRVGLEVEAIRRATAACTSALSQSLDHNIDQQTGALDNGDLKKFYELDEELHELVFGAAGYAGARRLLDAARAPLDRVRRLVLPQGERAELTLREHKWLVEAVKSGDTEFAGAAMRAHLNAVSSAIESHLHRISQKEQ